MRRVPRRIIAAIAETLLIASRTQGTSCAFPPKGEDPGKQRVHDSLVAEVRFVEAGRVAEGVDGDVVGEAAVVADVRRLGRRSSLRGEEDECEWVPAVGAQGPGGEGCQDEGGEEGGDERVIELQPGQRGDPGHGAALR